MVYKEREKKQADFTIHLVELLMWRELMSDYF